MKTSTFTFHVLSIFVFFCEKSESSSLVAQSIDGIMREYFVYSEQRLNIVHFGLKNFRNEKVIKVLLKVKPEFLSVEIIKAEKNMKLKTSSIIFFNSVDEFRSEFKNIKWQTDPEKRHEHLVYVPNLKVRDIEESVQDGFEIDKVNFLMHETKKSIELVSSFMFSAEKCRKNQLVTINKFFIDSRGWESYQFFPSKYHNLHGCTLNIGVMKAMPLARKINTALSEVYNFSINYQPLSKNDDLIELTVPITDRVIQTSSTSVTLRTKGVVFAVAPGEPYTTFERMFIMFDIETWIAIIITMSTGLIVIAIINRMSRKVQDFVYGQNIRTPTLNLFNIFLNGGQMREPNQNFSRFLFMMFIIWCLIIRTCYQSKMFEYLKADIRKPTIQTLQELRDKDYKILIADTISTGNELKKMGIL